jgi:hypothetical protein
MIEGFSELEHEGYLALILNDGSDTGEWNQETEHRMIGRRPACVCGWRGSDIYDDLPEGPEAESALMESWRVEHAEPLAWRSGVRVALDDVRDAESRLVRAVAAARVGGGSWTEIGDVLGVSKQAAHERFANSIDVLNLMVG